MSMLNGLNTDKDIKDETDRLGFGGALPSDVYKLVIDKAFLTVAASEAMALNVWFKTAEGRDLRQQFWIRSGKVKGLKNFYKDKTGAKQYLPGFNHANALCLLTVGKEISKMVTTVKTLPLYNGKKKKEIPTDVEIIEALSGKEIMAGVLRIKDDKREKDPHSGDYVPTGDTREFNEVDKLFRAKDGKTVMEIRGKTDSIFKDKWVAKWQGKVDDKSSKTSGVVQGAPKTISPSASTQAAAATAANDDDDLFAD